jgi:hypothetical protein
VLAVWGKSPETEIGLMEFGERPAQLADFSRSATLFDKGLGRLAQHTGSGAYLLEAVSDAAKALKKREAKHPVIIVFTMESSPEFSSLTSQRIEDALKADQPEPVGDRAAPMEARPARRMKTVSATL